GADKNEVPYPALQHINGRQRLRPGVKRGINHHVKAARAQRLLQVPLLTAIAIETLNSRRKLAASHTAIEYSDGVSALMEQLNNGQAKIPCSTNDEYLNIALLWIKQNCDYSVPKSKAKPAATKSTTETRRHGGTRRKSQPRMHANGNELTRIEFRKK